MQTRELAHLSRTFCSARDRNVPVLMRDGDANARATSGAELVSCLDYGVRCTGWLCPLFPEPALPSEDLLEGASQAEGIARRESVSGALAILERARREGEELRAEAARWRLARRTRSPEDVLPEKRPEP